MKSFSYHNPVNIIFGAGSISRLDKLIAKDFSVLLLSGSGSIKNNGVYQQIKDALKERRVEEFWGIEPNPDYDTCMKAVELIHKKKIDFILAAGGGSVADAAKFISAAVCYSGKDPWAIVADRVQLKATLPFGLVLTLAATGSEMNPAAVISRRSMGLKRSFASPKLFPRFSILDPETTYSVSEHMSACGVVDAWVHVLEQYLSHSDFAPLQDRQAEAILLTLKEYGPRLLKNLKDYNTRACVMWCATQALNGLISCGVSQDWSTHLIGHEFTAAFGLVHAESLALILPALLRERKEKKEAKLIQYGKRVWGISEDNKDIASLAIDKTELFFRELGLLTRLPDYDISLEAALLVSEIIKERGLNFGEDKAIDGDMVLRIIERAAEPWGGADNQ